MKYSVAIVGATGAVGQELLQVLETRRFPVRALRLLASEQSAGKEMRYCGERVRVDALRRDSFHGIDIAFFSAGSARSKQFAPYAAQAGAVVIDNSSAFRMEPEASLVIPEVNPEAIASHKGIIANPNCSTIIMLMALEPLRRLSRIRRVVVSTYQAASGAGARAMQELLDATRAYLDGAPYTPAVLPHPYAFNLFSHDSAVGDDGYNEEERKMILETRKIWGDSEGAVSPTCVRVPVCGRTARASSPSWRRAPRWRRFSRRTAPSKASHWWTTARATTSRCRLKQQGATRCWWSAFGTPRAFPTASRCLPAATSCAKARR